MHRSRLTLHFEQLEDRCVPSAVGANPRELTVMSRNLYVGADITPVVVAVSAPDPDPVAIIGAVTQTWQGILNTNFPERADALADEIELAMPHLIGLQEVSLLRTGAPDRFFGNATQATDVEFDYLEILLDELSSRGLHYGVVAVTTNFDEEFTGFAGTELRDIRLTDRDVILARTDLPPSQMKLSNVQAQNFTVNLQIPLADGTFFTALRGWNSVDVKIRGQEVRFINTHLESDVPLIRDYQAAELIAGPANTAGNVILVGDFNAPAGGTDATYNFLISAGFTDAWSETHPGDPGYTYGNDPDLANPNPLDPLPGIQLQRIDLVLFRGDVVARGMDRIGDDVKTVSGLWPSDHAGVVATLGIHVRSAPKHHAAPREVARFVRRLASDDESFGALARLLCSAKKTPKAALDHCFAQWDH